MKKTLNTSPKPPAGDVGTFLLIIEQFPLGHRFNVEHIRSDLEAAQIHPSRYGPLFGEACRRGELRNTGISVVERKASRKGGRACIYQRTAPAVPKTTKATRPSTKRIDTKGPHR